PHTGDNRDRDVGSRFLPSGGLLLPTGWPVNPFRGKTTDRRAGCGKSARPVRREGERQSRSPYPYVRLGAHLVGEVKVLSRGIQRRSVTACNCAAARRGGEQQEGERPVRRITNSIRP